MKKSKKFKIVIASFAIVLVLIVLLFLVLGKDKKGIPGEMSYTTNKGNLITMKYMDLDEIYIKMPEDFGIMDELSMKLKYPSENRPKLIYTNEDGSINLAFNFKSGDLSDENFDEIEEAIKSMFEKLSVELESETIIVNGLKLYVLKMTTNSLTGKIYNHMVYFINDNQLSVVSFNCPIENKNEWKEVAEYIFSSIKLK